MSRRAFLGAAIGSLAGLTGTARADRTDRLRQRVDEQMARFSGTVTETGFLDRPAFVIDDESRPPQTPYCPQPGDLMFSRSRYFILRAGHYLSGAGEPSHSGMVWRRPDGSLALLEAGPFDVPIICSMDLVPYMVAYHNRGRVWFRTRAVPLTAQQDCCLTEFALRQEDKRFARFRMYGQITRVRVRGPVRSYFIGEPNGPDRVSFFCAEMCAEIMAHCGMIDPANTRPAATYPHDLFFDKSNNHFLNRHFKLAPCWNPPARWRPHPCGQPCKPVD